MKCGSAKLANRLPAGTIQPWIQWLGDGGHPLINPRAIGSEIICFGDVFLRELKFLFRSRARSSCMKAQLLHGARIEFRGGVG
jgi:hypothetical protein